MPDLRMEVIAYTPYFQLESRIRLNVLNALRRIGTRVRHDFMATVTTWESPATFSLPSPILSAGDLGVAITTNSQRWASLNAGWPAHLVFARKSKALAIHTDSVPKTTPEEFTSRPGRRGGVIYRKSANAGPIEARNWTGAAAIKYTPEFVEEVNLALEKAGFEGIKDKTIGG